MLTTRIRDDGKYVVISDDMACVYASREAFDNAEEALSAVGFYEAIWEREPEDDSAWSIEHNGASPTVSNLINDRVEEGNP